MLTEGTTRTITITMFWLAGDHRIRSFSFGFVAMANKPIKGNPA